MIYIYIFEKNHLTILKVKGGKEKGLKMNFFW